MVRKVVTLSVVLLFLLAIASFSPQDKTALSGAWVLQNGNEEQVLLFADGYFTHTTFNKVHKQFIQTRGGTASVDKNAINVLYEFDTRDKEAIGKTIAYSYSLKNNRLLLSVGGKEETWERVDDGSTGLAGLWTITARRQGSELIPIHVSGTRKTVKILTGTRFQWAAIDPGTKQFMGTGGGNYTFKDGKYTEHITFFSRDSSRVGSSLSFDGKLENGDWHHSGLSSRGEPIYEVWSRKK